MSEALSPILNHLDVDRMHRVVVYAMPESAQLVDQYAEPLAKPHLLEWNFFNSWYAQHVVATDLDGIICHNPPKDDVPKWVPRLRPVTIVTVRPECERSDTERWLAEHGVQVRRLITWPSTSAVSAHSDRVVLRRRPGERMRRMPERGSATCPLGSTVPRREALKK